MIFYSNFNQADIDKISIVDEMASNFTYSQKSYFSKYNWKEIDQLPLP